MMRSLSSAVAGLRTHQTKMDVIGNNIANVNTYGFKASRTTFADVYYQNLTGSKGGVRGTSGGKNPTQLGYGAAVATVDVMNTTTGATTTNKWSDVYITGDGFIVSKDMSGKVSYSRLGNLDFDAAGNLVDGNGRLIQGFPMNSDGTPNISADGTIVPDQLQGINVDPAIIKKLTSLSISTTGAITGLLEGDPMIDPQSTNPDWINPNTMSIPTTSVYDGPVNFAVSGLTDETTLETALGLNSGAIVKDSIQMGSIPLPASAGTTVGYTVTVDKNGLITIQRPAVTGADPAEDAIKLTGAIKDGKLVFTNARGDVAMSMQIDKTIQPGGATPTTTGTTNPLALELYYQMSTTDKGGNAVKEPALPTKVSDIGTPPATLQLGELTLEISSQPWNKGFVGMIGIAKPAQSTIYNIGNLVIAKFQNAGGLQQAGSSYFEETVNSGEPELVMPGLSGTGPLKSGSLEMSNVDISQEFTDMITTQRGFQANSRIISVSDEMLQELVNLKR